MIISFELAFFGCVETFRQLRKKRLKNPEYFYEQGEFDVQPNDTTNQHYLSRVEQKLNAMNPQANPENYKIYSFKIVDRNSYTLALESHNGKSIYRNLSIFDLFSFDVLGDKKVRHNFESLFNKYEAQVENLTKSLLNKLKGGRYDIETEIVDLFAAKLLNFVRNPFSVVKVLNTFPDLALYEPTNPELLATCHRIVSGRKPHQKYLCTQLGIRDSQYIEWLRLLFMLLRPMVEGRPNFFDESIKGMLSNRKMHIAAYIFDYDSSACLLSDRGFSQPIEEGEHDLAFSFNLCSTAFIHYLFIEPASALRGEVSPECIERSLKYMESLPHNQVHVTFLRNDIEKLKHYNRRVIEQSHCHVFCSIKDGLVI